MKHKKILSGILSMVMLCNVFGTSLVSYAANVEAVPDSKKEVTETTQDVETEKENSDSVSEKEEKSNEANVSKKEDASANSNKSDGSQKEEQDTSSNSNETVQPFDLKASISELHSLITSTKEDSFQKVVTFLLESDHFYEIFSGLDQETQTLFFDQLTKEELYQFALYSKYAFVDSMISYEKKEALTKEDMSLFSSYVDLYEDVIIYNQKESIDPNEIQSLDQEVFETIIASLDKDIVDSEKIVDFTSYADYLQSLTTLDVSQILEQLNGFSCVRPDLVGKATKEFKNFIYAVYGFDELVEEIVEEEEKEDTTDKESENKEDAEGEDKKDENVKVDNYTISSILDYDGSVNKPYQTITVKDSDRKDITSRVEKVKLKVKLSDGETKEIDVDWVCSDDITNIEYEKYVFRMELPEGYSFSSDIVDSIRDGKYYLPYITVNVESDDSSNYQNEKATNVAWNSTKNKYYTSLSVAINEASSGDTIQIINNIETWGGIAVNKNINLVPQGTKTITMVKENHHMFQVAGGCTLSINGNGGQLNLNGNWQLNPDYSGGVVVCGSNSTVTLSGNVNIYNSDSNGIHLGNTGKLNINSGIKIHSCNYSGIRSYGIVTMNGGTIYNNKTTGVFNYGTFNLKGGEITNNTTPEYGAGIFNEGTLNMSGGTINKNTGKGAGGVFNKNIFNFSKGEISDNTSKEYAGGIFNSKTLKITGGTISNNTAGTGGAVFCNVDSSISISGAVFDGNKAVGGTTSDGKTLGDGGAISMDKGPLTTISSSRFSNNICVAAGGAVYGAFREINFEDVEMLNNSTGGGAVFVDRTTMNFNSCTFIGNKSADCAGAVMINSNGTPAGKGSATLTDCIIKSNSAVWGGGVFCNPNTTTTLINTNIESNTSSDNGGGVYNKEGTLKISGGTISNNISNASGGGVYLDGGLTTVMSGAISNNKATKSGGGIYSTNSASMTIEGGSISNNVATSGGGILNERNCSILFNGGIIESNMTKSSPSSVECDGAGIYNRGSVTMSGNAAISNNHSVRTGGGVRNHGTFKMESGSITGNVADVSGGGIFNTDENVAKLSVIGGKINNNTANSSGGGLFIDSNINRVTLSNCDISNNSATKGSSGKGDAIGGGIYIKSVTVVINGTSAVNNNKAIKGSGIFSNGSLDFVSGSVSENIAEDAGSIFVNGGTTNLIGGTLKGNKSKYGGAVLVNNGILNLKGSTINGNTADMGGAIFNNPDGITNISSGKISGNTAEKGAGIYNKAQGNVNLTGGTIESNTGSLGTGIYQDGTLKMSGAASVNANNDVYLPTGRFITVSGALTKTSGTIAKITPADYLNGRKVVQVTYGSKLGSSEFAYGNKTQKFALTSKDIYVLRPSDYLDAEAKLAKSDIIISSEYQITYDKNCTEDVANMPTAQKKYWNEKISLSSLIPVWEKADFKGWDPNPKVENGSYQPSDVYKENKNLALYAIWDRKIVVVYDGNGSDSGTQKSEVITEQKVKTGYNVKENENFTSYTKKDSGFAGWDSDDMQLSYEASYKKEVLPKNISFDELYSIYESQARTRSTTSLTAKEAKALGVERNTPVATFYAVWDKAPELKPKETLEFYEGEKVTKEMLIDKIDAFDREDDKQNLPLDIRITKIEYSAGKLVDGEKQPAYTDSWKSDMPDDYLLDTWFLQMDKEDSPVSHKITYEVTDSFGNTTSLDCTIKVKYNEFPEIKGEDRYFTLEEAQAGAITAEELLSRARAWDLEDCAEEDCVQNHEPDKNCLDDKEKCKFAENLTLVGYDADEFQAFTESGFVVLNYKITDRFGKETVSQFVVYVVKDGETVEGPDVQYVRFINEKNYDKNASVSKDDLSEEELESLNQNGGLNIDSKWYTEEEYRNLLKQTFQDATSDELWLFEHGDIEDVKAYVEAHGVGNSQEAEGLSGFLDAFGTHKQ